MAFPWAIKNPVAGPGFWGVPWRRARPQRASCSWYKQVGQVSGWAVHRLRKAHYVFALIKHTSREMFVRGKLIFELAAVAPESQRLSRQTKDYCGLAGVQIFRHSTLFFHNLGLQTRVSTPDLSIHVKCLESGRQGAARDFSQYKNTIPLTFKGTLKAYCFTDIKKPRQV